MWLYPTGVHRHIDRQRMRRTLADSSAVIMNTPKLPRACGECSPQVNGAKVFAVPNGFSATDFGPFAPPREDGAFRIVHTGSLHTELVFANGREDGCEGACVEGRCRASTYLRGRMCSSSMQSTGSREEFHPYAGSSKFTLSDQ